jgi:hypothetical protein
MIVTGIGQAAVLFSSKLPASAPIDKVAWAMSIAMGLPLFLWGRSVFRRARKDTEIVETIGFGKSPNRRGLAWVALIFSAFAVATSLALIVSDQKNVGTGASGGAWFVLVFVAALRYLRTTAAAQRSDSSPSRESSTPAE